MQSMNLRLAVDYLRSVEGTDRRVDETLRHVIALIEELERAALAEMRT